ncbi:MAG: HAD family hydrolase, partial [Flavobacteriales bacterium]|nr:HAD family hydrolase [Flavobacteriales bacterium]
ECYAQGFNDYFAENNISRNLTKEDIYGYMGMEESKFLEVTLPELSVDDRKTAYSRIIEFQNQRIKTDGGILYDGVKEGLKELSEKYKLFIVSNCPEFTIDFFMKWAGIEDLITDTFAHGKNHKPKHHNIKLIIEKHGLNKPYYIGDTDSDSKQSSLVPLPFVFVDYGFGTTKNYDLKFSSFDELKDFFMKE